MSKDNDNIKKAKDALLKMRQYQDLWVEHGVDRVHLIYDDVESDWLEKF